MVDEESVTAANGKLIMKAIVDGDKRMPSEIAEEQGYVGSTKNSEEVIKAVAVALDLPEN